MTEYLIEDPDGFLIEIEGGLLMQDDEDGNGPIETRPPYLLCCPCPGPAPFSCDCQAITLLHPAVSGLWDIYTVDDPAPGPGCSAATFIESRELEIMTSGSITMDLETCGFEFGHGATEFDTGYQYVNQANPFPLPPTQVLIPLVGLARAYCCAPNFVLVGLGLSWNGGADCEGRYVSALERGYGRFAVNVVIDASTGVATSVTLSDALHGTTTELDPTGWGAYCADA